MAMVDQVAEKRTGVGAMSAREWQEAWIWIGHQLDEDRQRMAPLLEKAATPARVS